MAITKEQQYASVSKFGILGAIEAGLFETSGEGGGSDYQPSQNVKSLDQIQGVPGGLLSFDTSGKLVQVPTTPTGQQVLLAEEPNDIRMAAGLYNVDNTSDLEKPISSATQVKLDEVNTIATQTANSLEVLFSRVDNIPSPSGKALKRIALLGDSLSGNNTDLGKSYTRGFMTFAQQFSGHRLYFDSSLNFGVGGETAAQIAARVNVVIAAKPDIVLLELGGNDINQDTSADSLIASTTTCVNALTSAGIRVILCTIYTTSDVFNEARFLQLAKFNEWLLDAPSRYNLVEVLDVYNIMTNKATDLLKSDVTYDKTHPGAFGSWLMGKALASLIEQIAPVSRYRPLTNLRDKWVNTTNPSGNILTNPGYTGTSGTVSGAGGSGTIPTGLVLNMADAKGVTAACTVISGDDGFNTIEITLGGQATGTDPRYTTASHITLGEVFGGTTAWNTTDLGRFLRDTAVNQLLQMECEVENLVGVMAVGVESFFLSTGGTSKPSNGDGLYSVNQTVPTTSLKSLTYPTEASTRLILRAEPEANTGKANGYRVGLHITCVPGTPVSGKIRIRRPIFRAYVGKFI